MKIKINRITNDVKLPTKGTEEAACYDLYAYDIETYGNQAIVHLGFSTEIPKGYKAVIVPRSSFTKTNWVLQNSPAQIDSDYRGPWMLKFRAIPKGGSIELNQWEQTNIEVSYPSFPYEVGDRVAQMYIQEVIPFEFEEIDELSTTARGEGGFGSTGK